MANDSDICEGSERPLVLEIDRTLLRTDLFFESVWLALATNFWATLRALLSCCLCPAVLKRRLLDIAMPDVELSPVNENILARALKVRVQGRAVHLVSGNDQALVDAVGARFGFVGPHFGSDGMRNLIKQAKADLLVQRFGQAGYDYAGHSADDLPSWQGAAKAIAVTHDPRVKQRLASLGIPTDLEAADRFSLKVLWKELRPHQWIKNVLLFFPLLAMQASDPLQYVHVAIAAVAFSLGASAIYILNDLLDLPADRLHPEKRKRPIASGALQVPHAMLSSVGLIALALALVWPVSPAGALFTLTYMASSLGYSLWLKKRRWLDVLALATLFTLRVATGAVVAQVTLPLSLSLFVFFSFLVLACVKRVTALTRLATRDHLPGRGYGVTDLRHLGWVAHGAILLSVVSFWTFAFSIEAMDLYTRPFVLGLAVLPFACWLLRNLRMSAKGLEDYDPVVFVFHDRKGLALVAASFVLAFCAI
ncbi:UbiA family prenyltransferase [Shimia sp. SDUM112013]|uniref:UbiA family prenyltransferase n=1 Tax=Shimia sp. SDUM112013 TaxID=3136160 RepID=UPI0032ECE905